VRMVLLCRTVRLVTTTWIAPEWGGKDETMQPARMTRVVDGLRYDTETATLLAHDSYWDGSNMERHGRNTYLYRTPRGRYFAVYLTQWQGERDALEPLTVDEAVELYEGPLCEHVVEWAEAFPERELQDA